MFNQLSENYKEQYLNHLLQFQSRAFQYYQSAEWFVNFYPSIATVKETGFLVLGQAVNGWGTGFSLDKDFEEEHLRKSIAFSNKYCAERNHTPLDWVNVRWTKTLYEGHMNDPALKKFYPPSEAKDYWTSKSFFWNLVFKTICRYKKQNEDSWDWCRYMVWSNLYKIAPEDDNPNNIHCWMQQPMAAELVKMEIEELKPKFVIVPTNLEWWLPFRFHLDTQVLKFDKEKFFHIAAVEKYYDSLIVITNRPRFGNTDEFTEQICEILK